VKYAWILKHEEAFSIGMMCYLLGLKQSGYYYYKSKGIIAKARKLQESLQLQTAITVEFKASRKYSRR